MKLLNLNLTQKKKNSIYLTIIFVFYSVFVFLNKEFFFQKTNPNLVSDYLRSQDIEDLEGNIKDRIFISDADIYISSGLLYSKGASPSEFNFQHPPLTKYLFGLSSIYLNLPLFPNLIFGLLLLIEIFFLGKLIFKDSIIGLLSTILMILDPVFKEVSIYALLDLGQIVFVLGFLIFSFYKKGWWIVRSLLLGFSLAAKFYSPVLIFLFIFYFYLIYNKKFNFIKEFKIFSFAVLIYTLTYFQFFKSNNFYDFIILQGKMVKFMLTHNNAESWGTVLSMFFKGYFIWPILFFSAVYTLLKEKFMNLKFVVCFMSVSYLFVLTFQLPFTRYFILVLPFLYLSLGYLGVKKLKITF